MQQNELSKIINRQAKNDGVHTTAIPSLVFVRDSIGSVPRHGLYKPSFCIVVQGAKKVWLGEDCFNYNPSDYLISSVHLPVIAQVTEASPDVPYLGFILEFTVNQILEILRDSENWVGSKEQVRRGMFVSRMESSLLDAVIRLVRLLDKPKDISILAPLYTKEILYKVLQGEHGVRLKQIAIEGSSAHQINEIIEHITKNFNKSFRIEELAEKASMSVSSLHRHFKEITAMSPVQFQKQLRLQEARRLLLNESADAGNVAFRVGYESPSQFSREYSRLFGFPPRQDMQRFKRI